MAHWIHFNPEDGGSMYFRSVGNDAHIHTVQRPWSRININSEPLWKSSTSHSNAFTSLTRRTRGRSLVIFWNNDALSSPEINLSLLPPLSVFVCSYSILSQLCLRCRSSVERNAALERQLLRQRCRAYALNSVLQAECLGNFTQRGRFWKLRSSCESIWSFSNQWYILRLRNL